MNVYFFAGREKGDFWSQISQLSVLLSAGDFLKAFNLPVKIYVVSFFVGLRKIQPKASVHQSQEQISLESSLSLSWPSIPSSGLRPKSFSCNRIDFFPWGRRSFSDFMRQSCLKAFPLFSILSLYGPSSCKFMVFWLYPPFLLFFFPPLSSLKTFSKSSRPLQTPGVELEGFFPPWNCGSNCVDCFFNI